MAAIARALPRADLLYLADTAHVPYGDKSDLFIQGRVAAIGKYLREQGCSMIVVACNTATAAAVKVLRDQHPGLPIVGVEPGVKPAAASSVSRRIAVLATESTARSQRLARLIADHANGVHVHVEACPGWATRVETLHLDDPEFHREAHAHLGPLLEAGVDRFVLGCTHYTFLIPMLAPLIAGRAELVDVAEAVARQCVRLAGAASEGQGKLALHATSLPERLQAALAQLELGWIARRCSIPAQLAAV